MPNPSTARRGRARHRSPSPVGFTRFVAAAAVVLVVAVAWRSGVLGSLIGSKGTSSSASSPSPGRGAVTSAPATPSHPSHPPSTAAATPGPINTSFPGLTTFRGNATRDYYGAGPVPKHPTILWRYPRSGALCSSSNNLGVTKVWCGTGWTGQPNVIPHKDGTIEVREGAYDGHYHFLNGLTGEQLRPDLVTGDLAKGSATSDSQGYPLYYGGSRDNLLRVVALDRATPTVLWSYDSRSNPHLVWNDDWDAAPLEVGDYLMEGSENSWFYIWKLNRRYDANGLVQVAPQLMMEVPGYDSQLFASIHDQDVSIENSVAYDAARGVVYFANSGGLVQGWDVRDVLAGHPYVPGADVYDGRVFR
ncbi:MAG TPA: hypothetical protein VEN82_02520, partial [Actinomycetota bacterium]|nr:hypothetical protein [Actinomycetota bacterium]